MKKIKFDARFKEAVLNKEKVATIRNSKKVDVGEVFEIVIDNEVVVKAECTLLSLVKREYFLERLRYYKKISATVWNPSPIDYVFIKGTELGFAYSITEMLDCYNDYLKNEHCYLHIFELIEG